MTAGRGAESSQHQWIVCRSLRFAIIYGGLVMRCTSCGFASADTQLFQGDNAALYNDDYFDGAEVFDCLGSRDSRKLNFRSRFRRVLRMIGQEKIRSVVEIGCAYAFFGAVVREPLGAGVPYAGFNVARDAVAYAHGTLGLDARCEDYMNVGLPQPVSDVFKWDVIEHLPHPGRVIDKVRADLAAGGRLGIATRQNWRPSAAHPWAQDAQHPPPVPSVILLRPVHPPVSGGARLPPYEALPCHSLPQRPADLSACAREPAVAASRCGGTSRGVSPRSGFPRRAAQYLRSPCGAGGKAMTSVWSIR